MKMKNLWAFTLIELLVVISIIAILAAVLTPAVTRSLTRAKMTGLMSNGVQIHRATFETVRDTVSAGNWPSSAGFKTSTEYFRRLVTGNQLNVSFPFFAASGVRPYSGTNAPDFLGAHNVWNMVADLNDDYPDPAPFLFTKNLDIQTMAEIKPAKDNLAFHLKSKADRYGNPVPFGDVGVVAISKNGSGRIWGPTDGDFNNFGVTNIVLLAGPGGASAGGQIPGPNPPPRPPPLPDKPNFPNMDDPSWVNSIGMDFLTV